MRMAVGLVRPDSGSVAIGGVPVDAPTLPGQWSALTAMKVTAELAGVPGGRVSTVLDRPAAQRLVGL
jgi:hypothetical protein